MDKNRNEQRKFTVNFMTGVANSLIAAGVLTPVLTKALTGNMLDGESTIVVVICLACALLLYLMANTLAGEIE